MDGRDPIATGWRQMTRAIAPVLLDTEPFDSDGLGEALAQMVLIGGAPKRLAEYIFARLGAPRDARLARRNDAVIVIAARFQAPPDRKQREHMASALARYAATGWLRERLGTVEGAKDAAMFAVLKNSPASGPPGERTIREILSKNQRLLPAHAIPQCANHNNKEAA
jgi:hypothetical protein